MALAFPVSSHRARPDSDASRICAGRRDFAHPCGSWPALVYFMAAAANSSRGTSTTKGAFHELLRQQPVRHPRYRGQQHLPRCVLLLLVRKGSASQRCVAGEITAAFPPCGQGIRVESRRVSLRSFQQGPRIGASASVGSLRSRTSMFHVKHGFSYVLN